MSSASIIAGQKKKQQHDRDYIQNQNHCDLRVRERRGYVIYKESEREERTQEQWRSGQEKNNDKRTSGNKKSSGEMLRATRTSRITG